MLPNTHSVRLRDGFQLATALLPRPSAAAVEAAWRALDPLVKASIRRLAAPSGDYNCHGLVLASRRGNVGVIGLDVDLDDILVRDGFRRLGDEIEPRVGDIVAYREASATDRVRRPAEIEHTGFVSRVETVGAARVVWIWSAWGGLGEFEHQLAHCPYRGRPEFWRLQ